MLQFKLHTVIACTLLSVYSSVAATKPVDTEARIDELINQMTIEEKIGQINQRTGAGKEQYMIDIIAGSGVGSILNETDPETINYLQRIAVEKTRLHIPLVFARDVIHGFKTIFPIPLGQAATFNLDLARDAARIAADEASSVGIRWTFSPMLDVSRDARWGRIAESSGEDTYLNTMMGLAMIQGYQGDDISKPNTMAACAKHFAGYGVAESGKDYNTTWIPEVQLREVYLPPFKAAAKAGAATFMCSFNDINGVPSSGNKHLLRDILRDEWGYDGLMVSDWGSIEQMIPHGVCANKKDAALLSATAGVDMDMESHVYTAHIKELVESGKLDVKILDNMVRNVLRLKFRLGLFENPYVDMSSAKRFYGDANLAKACQAAEESAVLLTNNGILPLADSYKKIAVVGPMSDAQHDQAGTWSFDLEKEHCITPLTALRQMYGEKSIIAEEGLTFSRDYSSKGIDAAVKAAEKADVVLMFAGEEAVLSGEAHCRADISLPGAQTKMLEALKATGKPVVLIVMCGRPLTLSTECSLADAVVFALHGGTMAGPALANLLSGKANFSGRLPITLPRMVGQMPLYYAHKNTGRPAAGITLIDDIELEAGQTSTGCTSYYLDAGDSPLFPFGYGLGYSQFTYSDVKLSSTEIAADGKVKAVCKVTNNGNRQAAEVVQLYVRDVVASLARPVRELKGFKKLTFAPGESKTVEFEIDADMLAFHHLDGTCTAESGEFQVWIAPNAAAGTPASFNLK